MTGTKTETGRCTAWVSLVDSPRMRHSKQCGEPIRKNQAGELEHWERLMTTLCPESHHQGRIGFHCDMAHYGLFAIDRGHPALGLEEAEDAND